MVTGYERVHSLEFVDAPPPSRRATWSEVARNLRARPGEWALLDTESTAVASQMRRGIGVFRGGRWESTTRRTLDGRTEVYARFIGDA